MRSPLPLNIRPRKSSATGAFNTSPVNASVAFRASTPEVPSKTCTTTRSPSTSSTCPRRAVPSPSSTRTISAYRADLTLSNTTSGPLTPVTVRYSARRARRGSEEEEDAPFVIYESREATGRSRDRVEAGGTRAHRDAAPARAPSSPRPLAAASSRSRSRDPSFLSRRANAVLRRRARAARCASDLSEETRSVAHLSPNGATGRTLQYEFLNATRDRARSLGRAHNPRRDDRRDR